ncbi:DUF2066 domain-containing protein [Kangiella sp.]|uniref:DUF2066 domain-containing protein n=1 Tax=Kangiella sp. TaxID=1920245 RepID=UPI0019B5F346|nr:DUF2066 domain-containing protein [Kangiella sp.]MBD3653801.1 DUF2066 domain-containing protein [Kangiella sp.]
MKCLVKQSSYCASLLFVLFTGFFIAPVKAERVTDLYSASWPVENQSTDVRQKAMQNAFAEVLVRVSGSKDVVNNSQIREVLPNAQDYMRQYSYKRLSAAEQMVYERPLLLVATFDSLAVKKILQDASLPVWSENRPSGTFWIAVEENGNRRVATDANDSVTIALNRAASRRGLPIMLPMMDLEDKSQVTVGDIWGRFVGPINRASERYNADYVVVGQLSQSAGQWFGRWSMDLGGTVENLSSSASSKQDVIADLVDQVANKLAARLAVVLSGEVLAVEIYVNNIYELEAYAGARNYLANLGMTESVKVLQVKDDAVLFEVRVLTSPQNLIDAINIGNNLRRIPNDEGVNGRYSFSWQG